MDITEGTSGATAESEKERPETHEDYLKAARHLYEDSNAHILRLRAKIQSKLLFPASITSSDNNYKTVSEKVGAILNLEREFQAAMTIYQAKESIDSAFKKNYRQASKKLDDDITKSFKYAKGAVFQYYKTLTAHIKAKTFESLSTLYKDNVEIAAANPPAGPNLSIFIELLGKLKDKSPSVLECHGEFIKESINYEKRFPEETYKLTQVRMLRKESEMATLLELEQKREALIKDISKLLTGEYFVNPQAATKNLSEDEIGRHITKLDSLIATCRNIVKYMEMLLKPKIYENSYLKERGIDKRKLELLQNQLTVDQAMVGFWQYTKLVHHIDASTVNQNIKESVVRIYDASRRLARGLAGCYPEFFDVDNHSADVRENKKQLAPLAISYELIACECQRMAGNVSGNNSEMLIKIGNIFSEVEEGIYKKMSREGFNISVPASEIEAISANLFGAKNIGQEGDISEEVLGDKISTYVSGEDKSHTSVEEVNDDEVANFDEGVGTQTKGVKQKVGVDKAREGITSDPFGLSEREKRITARLVEDVRDTSEKKARLIKEINEYKKKMEKNVRNLEEKIEKVKRIKEAFKEGTHNQYSSLDLENDPKRAMDFSRLAAKNARDIVKKLKELEELSLSKGAVSDDEHEKEINEYARKAFEYEQKEKEYRSDSKELPIKGIKADLCTEAVRKSNAAQTLLIKLIDLEGHKSLKVRACKTLPHCPPATDGSGILLTAQGGNLLYDHVVEFQVKIEGVPPFAVHFHFRSPDDAVKKLEFYLEKKGIRDWNVQSLQKQATVPRQRYCHLEGGRRVLEALKDVWKLSLEKDKKQKQTVSAKPKLRWK